MLRVVITNPSEGGSRFALCFGNQVSSPATQTVRWMKQAAEPHACQVAQLVVRIKGQGVFPCLSWVFSGDKNTFF